MALDAELAAMPYADLTPVSLPLSLSAVSLVKGSSSIHQVQRLERECDSTLN